MTRWAASKWTFYWLLHGLGVCGLLLSFRLMSTFNPMIMGIAAGLWMGLCTMLARLLVIYWDKFKIKESKE